jgi:hypothetical protein
VKCVKIAKHPLSCEYRRVSPERRQLLLALELDALTKLAEGLELVDELVNHVPQPPVVVGRRQEASQAWNW